MSLDRTPNPPVLSPSRMHDQGDVTQMLIRFSEGDKDVINDIIPAIYKELREIASNHLRRESQDITLSTTSLVHEVYLKLIKQDSVKWNSRNHFFAIASQAMRRFLIDHARAKLRLKRGGGEKNVRLDDVLHFATDDQAEEFLELNEALDKLKELNPRGSEVIQYWFFGGLKLDEAAEVMGLSTVTIRKSWYLARAWLRTELGYDFGADKEEL